MRYFFFFCSFWSDQTKKEQSNKNFKVSAEEKCVRNYFPDVEVLNYEFYDMFIYFSVQRCILH